MILVDSRAGSKDLVEPMKRAGMEVVETVLMAGDIGFTGRGPEGTAKAVGIEYKKWADLLACMRSGRFAAQLRGMKAIYDYQWLVVEGRIRPGKKGLIEEASWRGTWTEMHGRYTYQEATAWVTTMAARGGMQVWRTETMDETVAWLRSQYLWWTAKDWEDHRAHLDFYLPPPGEQFSEPTVVQRMAMALPGIGAGKAYRVAETFSTPQAMCNAVEEQWRKVEGVGKVMARRLVRACQQPGAGDEESV